MAGPRVAALSNDEILALYRRGDYSRTRLARLARVSRTRVDRVLAEAGIDLVPSYLDESVRQGILNSYATGLSIPDVARTYRVAVGTATLVILRAGVLRTPGRPPGRLRLHPGIDVMELYAAGGVAAIAEMAGVSTSTAYRLVAEAKSLPPNDDAPIIFTADLPCEVHAGRDCVECGP
jgi:hypothetical protein